jgi:hypothetical protein
MKRKAERILDRYMDKDFSLLACGENAASEKEIKAFEKKIGFTLPEDFREFSMSPLGSLLIEVKEDIWPRGKAFDVGPFWSFLYGLYTILMVSERTSRIGWTLEFRKKSLKKRQATKLFLFLRLSVMLTSTALTRMERF